ncbi:MAG TPA: acetate uptake transporter [Arsenophonus sp.]
MGYLYTLFMFFTTLKTNQALQLVFASLTVLFALLAIDNMYENQTMLTIAGFEDIICGASAFYLRWQKSSMNNLATLYYLLVINRK